MTLDEAINKLESDNSPMSKSNILAALIILRELKTTRKALVLACKRLGRLEQTCEGCIAEACENYINDEECSKIIMSKYLQKAREE